MESIKPTLSEQYFSPGADTTLFTDQIYTRFFLFIFFSFQLIHSVRAHPRPTLVSIAWRGSAGLDNTRLHRYIELRLLVHHGVGGRGVCTPAFPFSFSPYRSPCPARHPCLQSESCRTKTSSQLTNNPKQFGRPDRISSFSERNSTVSGP